MARSKKTKPNSSTAPSGARQGTTKPARELAPPRKKAPPVPEFDFSPLKVWITRGREFVDDYIRTLYYWWEQKARLEMTEAEQEVLVPLLETVRVLKGRQVELDSYPRVLDVEALLRVGPPTGQPAGQVAYFAVRACSDETQPQRVAVEVDGHSFSIEYLLLDDDWQLAEDQYLSDAATVLFRALSSKTLDLETIISPTARFFFLLTLIPQSVANWSTGKHVPLAPSEEMEQRLSAARNARPEET